MKSFVTLRSLSSLFSLLFCCVACAAQQVSPAVMEYPGVAQGSKVEGHFDLANDSLEPLFVTIEAKSFTIDRTGNAVFTRLQSDIKLDFSSTSVRLGPKQRRSVYYRVTGATAPSWFCIYSNFSGLPRRNGMNVQLELPHTVYIYGKEKVRAEQMEITDLKQVPGHLTGRVTNHGANVIRVLAMDTAGDRLKNTQGGFPLLPGMERDFDYEVPEGKTVRSLRANTASFHIDKVLP